MSYELAKAYLEKVGGMEYVHHRELYIDTVEDAAKSIGCTEAEIAKSLTFMVGEQPVMIVMAGDTKVNSSKFKNYFHCKPSMIPRDRVQELVGHEPGGVCAFGIKDGIDVYLDVSLKRFEMVHSAAGDDYTTFDSSPEILEKYTPCKGWVDVCKILGEE